MYAIYARQSVERPDSISIESQIDFCKPETRGAPFKIYTDRGFSGKNLDRPGFSAMMDDIRAGQIQTVVVYKLDRISRSILDFAGLIEQFQEYGVSFISTTEKFDTASPIGRAMLHICIVFAQLERETIQKRVKDSYYTRNKRGFYMGGRVPYGFQRRKTVISGVQTSEFIAVPDEADQIRTIYLQFKGGTSLGEIARSGLPHLRGGTWNTARLSELIRNPVYVKADGSFYDYMAEQGVQIINARADFIGLNGCYLYRSADHAQLSRSTLRGKELVLAPHTGLVSSELWLACQKQQTPVAASIRKTAKYSWLSGKVFCGNCGTALSLRQSNTSWGRYFICPERRTVCCGTGCTIYASVLEDAILEQMQHRIKAAFPLYANVQAPSPYAKGLHTLHQEIGQYLEKLKQADPVLEHYITAEIKKLDTSLQALKESERAWTCKQQQQNALEAPDRLLAQLSFQEKQQCADLLLKSITISNGEAICKWNL